MLRSLTVSPKSICSPNTTLVADNVPVNGLLRVITVPLIPVTVVPKGMLAPDTPISITMVLV